MKASYNDDLSKKDDGVSRLKELKETVEQSRMYFQDNFDRYHEFRKFVYDTQLTPEDTNKLAVLGKPNLEFNVLEAPISRLLGEFYQQEPSITVQAADGVSVDQLTPSYLKMIEFLEDYMRAVLNGSTSDDFQGTVFSESLSGGLSVVETYVDYVDECSFDQKFVVKPVFDCTLVGFDPLSRESTMGDGRYCFQLYPKTKAEFEREFGEGFAEGMNFSCVDSFSWSYSSQQEDIVLVCDFFEKVQKKEKLVKLSNGDCVLEKHYKELLKEWEERGFIEQPPIVVEKRDTEIISIDRTRFCDTKILSVNKTIYSYLPLVFFDGDSKYIKDESSGSMKLMTRPYAYRAKGIQQIINFAGQTAGGEMENMVQHKFKVSVEAIPEDFQKAYQNVQQADVLLYNQFYKGDPNVRLEPPMEIQRTPTPPLVESLFMGSNRMVQAILGSYDSVLGTNEMDVSGKAVANGSMHTSSVSAPYLNGYIKGLNRVAQIMVDLISKIMKTPRTLPVMKKDGKMGFQVVNDKNNPESISLNYKPNDLNVKVEASVNNVLQKQADMDKIIRMSQANPTFANFFNMYGLETILNNLDIKGIDSLKAKAPEFMEMMKQQQEQASQKVDPQVQIAQGMVQVEAAKVEQRKEEAEIKATMDAAKIALEKEKIHAQIMQIMNDIQVSNAKLAIDQEKVDSENARTAVETAMELGEKMSNRMEV